MSELKCPYCGGILEQSSIFNLNSYACTDLTCKGYYMTATKDMWQELIRTRKALDVAKYAIKNIQDDMKKVKDGDDIWEIQKNLHDYCKTTLKQIKALEQKDVK